MKKRRIAAILLGTLSLGILAGCGNNSGSGSAAASKAEAAEVQEASGADEEQREAPAEDTQSAGDAAETTGDAQEQETAEYDPVDITIGVDSSSFSAQLRIAQEAGFFEKYNINADLVTFSFGIDTINGVILNEVQIGEANDYAVATRAAQSSNLRLVSSILSGHGDSKSLYANTDEIQKGEDLKGRKLAVQSGTVNEFEWAKTLETYGLTKDDVEYLEFSSDAEALAAFQSKQAEAVWFSKQFKDEVDQVENSHAIATLADIDQVNVAYLVVDDTFLEENQEAVERVILALNDASAYIYENPDEAAQALSDSLGIAKEDAAGGLATYDYEIRFLDSDRKHITEVADWSIENGLIENVYDLNSYIITDAIKEVLPDKVDF